VETQLYHIAQEAINNAIRHGGADEILVRFFQDSEGLSLLIEDNGCGFSTKKVLPGLGLGNMRYRADIINGRLRIESEPERGTRVICVLT
jgi:signal transduction histidine kinase